jgi:hypothetical protein
LKIESGIAARRARAIRVTSPRLRGKVEAEGFGRGDDPRAEPVEPPAHPGFEFKNPKRPKIIAFPAVSNYGAVSFAAADWVKNVETRLAAA